MPQSTTISLIALLVSCGTTFVTYIRTYKQDIHDDRKELRELLKRIVALPREQLDITRKYAGDDSAILAFGKTCNEENQLIARQAAQIARRLKSKQESGLTFRIKGAISGAVPVSQNYISATEYLSIGFALNRAYNVQEAKEFLQYAAQTAVDFNDEIAALRNLGYLYFYLGKPEDGRNQYRAASQIFGKYRDYDALVQCRANIETELSWAGTELYANFKTAAMQHLNRAEELVASMPYGAVPGDTMAMMADTRRQFMQSSGMNPEVPPTSPAHPLP